MFPSFEGTLCSFHERVKTKFRRFALGFIFINQLQGSIVVIILQVAVELFENRMPLFLIFFLCLLCEEFWKQKHGTIGHLRVQLSASLSKRVLWKWVWFAWKWICRRNTFSYERFRTKTRFETEAKGNSKMAYYIVHNNFLQRSFSRRQYIRNNRWSYPCFGSHAIRMKQCHGWYILETINQPNQVGYNATVQLNRITHQEPATIPYSCDGVFADWSVFSLNLSRVKIPTGT